jgi:hypothetical protein
MLESGGAEGGAEGEVGLFLVRVNAEAAKSMAVRRKKKSRSYTFSLWGKGGWFSATYTKSRMQPNWDSVFRRSMTDVRERVRGLAILEIGAAGEGGGGWVTERACWQAVVTKIEENRIPAASGPTLLMAKGFGVGLGRVRC